MYIQPNSTIRVLRGIRWNPNYRDTVYWANANTKETYFISKTKYTLTEQSYQRAGSNTVRIQIPVDNLYDCNYLMFRNTSYENKWFYAFIVGITYVNNITSEITYVIDDMTTWFDNVDLNPCMVEREHVDHDSIGEHLEPEPISISNMTYRVPVSTDILEDDYTVIVAVADNDQIDFTGLNIARGYVSGSYTGVLFISVNINYGADVARLNQLLDDIVNANLTESVVGLFMYPASLFDTSAVPYSDVFSVPLAYMYTDIDGYVPKNNKLFTYPYNYMVFTDENGQAHDLRCELFTNTQNGFEFVIRGILSCDPKVVCYPRNYMNRQNQINYKIVMSDFPQCAFAVDSYKAWVANRGKAFLELEQKQIRTNFMGDVANFGTGVFNRPIASLANLAVQGATAVNQYERTELEFERAYYAPDIVRGSNTGDALPILRHSEFYFKKCCLMAEEARRADDFLSMYGYACNRTKIPNTHVREQWTFVKTKNSNVTPNANNGCPADVITNINSIFDSGVTFWRNPDNVGRYDLRNNIYVG